MTLLVNQLKYQDPMEPMSNSDMTGQLAQISQLEQMEKMNSFQQQLLQATQRADAAALLGKQIYFTPSGSDTPVTARVDGIDLSSGSVKVIAGGQSVDMGTIIGISNS